MMPGEAAKESRWSASPFWRDGSSGLWAAFFSRISAYGTRNAYGWRCVATWRAQLLAAGDFEAKTLRLYQLVFCQSTWSKCLLRVKEEWLSAIAKHCVVLATDLGELGRRRCEKECSSLTGCLDCVGKQYMYEVYVCICSSAGRLLR